MKNSDLIDSIESINAVAALKQPVRTAFVVALNLKAVRDHMVVFEEQRKKLVAQHTRKDKDGEPLKAYAPAFDAAGKSILTEDGEPLLDAEGKMLLDKDGKPPRAVEGQVRLIDGGKPFQKDFKELLDFEFTSKEVFIRPVKLSLLEGSIEPTHLANITWMINDDTVESPKPA